ncbi:MAG: helix-turn-helix domain-containing protein [Gammaproteobacteria bacterium]|nr:helix-turn-helix domain-containing protein [Gammaproteobacteria bacterium]
MHDKTLILRPKSVCAELGISISTFWRLVKSGKLKTVKLSDRCTGIRRDCLTAYIDQDK